MADRDNGGIITMCVIFTLFMGAGVAYFFYQQGAISVQTSTVQPPAAVPMAPVVQGFGPIDSQVRTRTLSRAIADNPDAIEERVQRASAYEELGEYEDAIADCDEVLQRQPHHHGALLRRASLMMKMEEFAKAKIDLDALIEGYNADAAIFDMRGDVRAQLRDYEGAVSDYTQSLDRQPANPRGLMKRGSANARAGRFESAVADYDRVVATYSSYGPAYRTRGMYKLQAYDVQGALDDLQEAVRLDPTRGEAHADLARVKLTMGNLDDALADANTAIQLHPFLAGGYTVRASIAARRGEFRSALADIDQALKTDNLNDDLFRQRGWINWSANDPEAASSDFERALAIDATSMHSHLGLGITKLMVGDVDAAKKCLDQATAEQDGATDYAQLFRWLAYAHSQQREQANTSLSEYARRRTPRGNDDWPGTLIDFMLGKLNVEDVMKAAESSNEFRQRDRLCEAHFYAAQWHLLTGDQNQAIPLFEKCIESGQTQFYEYHAANAALKKLKTN
jgi:tetratricopeptide (TPR) repeat protein